MALAQAAALERLGILARAMAVAQADAGTNEAAQDGDEGEDEKEDGLRSDLALFRASLAATAPELAQDLAAALDSLSEASATQGSAEATTEVVFLVKKAQGRLLTDVPDGPGFTAAIMASLLLEEGGVAESYEEAVEGDRVAYAAGWHALQRVKDLWSGLSAETTPDQAENAAAMLDLLDALFPGEAMPVAMASNPEQAEAPAQMFVGVLEGVTDADLYPGRSAVAAVTLVRDVAVQGCEAFRAGDSDIGAETLLIASAYYDQTLADTIGVIAPEAGGAIMGGLEAAVRGEGCADLLDALAASQEALGQ